MRGSIPSRSCGARSELITSRRPAEMISFIVWKNSSWVDSLPAMNWTSSIISRSAARSCCLNWIVSLARKRRDELDHELLGRHVDDLRARLQAMEFMADGVQQVGLAAPGAAMEEERVEGDLVGAGQGPRGVEGDLVRLADDEALEPVAGLERDRIEAGLGLRAPRSAGAGNLDHRGGGRRGRADLDPDPLHVGQPRLPGERQPLGEMGLHPIGHELRRQLEPERARIRHRSRRARSAAASRRRCGRRNRGEGPRGSLPRQRRPDRRWAVARIGRKTPFVSLLRRSQSALFIRRKTGSCRESPPGAPLPNVSLLFASGQEIRPAGNAVLEASRAPRSRG